MEEVIRSTDPALIACATALLRSEDIESFELDVHMSVMEGSVGVLPRRVVVRRADAHRANAALKAAGLTLNP